MIKNIIWAIIGLIIALIVGYIAISEEFTSFLLSDFLVEDNKGNTGLKYGEINTFVIGEKPSKIDVSEIIPPNEVRGLETPPKNRSGMISEHVKNHSIKDGASKICHPRKRVVFNGLTKRELEAKELKKHNIRVEQIDEEVDKCIKKITRNWKRLIKRRIVYGYDEDEDSDLRFELKKRALEGKKIC